MDTNPPPCLTSKSGTRSPFQSAVASTGAVPSDGPLAPPPTRLSGWKVPSPRPNRTERSCDSRFIVTISTAPSRLRSTAIKGSGLSPTASRPSTMKWRSPWSRAIRTSSLWIEETTSSSRPSESRSATASDPMATSPEGPALSKVDCTGSENPRGVPNSTVTARCPDSTTMSIRPSRLRSRGWIAWMEKPPGTWSTPRKAPPPEACRMAMNVAAASSPAMRSGRPSALTSATAEANGNPFSL